MEQIEHFSFREKKDSRAEEIERKLISFIHETTDSKERFLGEGKTAEVSYWSEENTQLCIKIISESRMNDLYEDTSKPRFNSPKQEGEFMEKASKTTTKVKLPEVIGYISFEDSSDRRVDALLMSRINGITLKQAHENPSLIPEKFNLEEYFSELEKFLNEMHTHDRIHHRDLSEGNLMIDQETGVPVVIDFGDATYDFGYDKPEDIYKTADGSGNHLYISEDYPKDLVIIKSIKRNLETRLGKK